MAIPVPSTFQTIIASHDGSAAGIVNDLGVTVTPAEAAYGAWHTVIVGASVTDDVWEIAIRFHDADTLNTATAMLADLGVDPAGGTDFASVISGLAVTYAGPYVTSGATGIEYRFKLHIAAGSSIGVRGATTNAALPTFACSAILYCNPTKPWALWKGTFVRTFGENLAACLGVVVTPGVGTNEGTWAEIGTLADTIYEWQLGVSSDDGTTSGTTYHLDLGVETGAAGKRVAILDQKQSGTTAEIWNRPHAPGSQKGVVGDKVYGRAQASVAGADANFSMIAYGVGGSHIDTGLYTVAGTIEIDGVAAANGKTVEVYALDSDGVSERVTTTTVAGGAGAYTVEVPDNTRTHFASYEDGAAVGRSVSGTPDSDTFDITIFTSAGGDPDVILTGMPVVETDETSAEFTFTISDGDAEYSLDGAAYVPATSPITVTGLDAGQHMIVIRSTTTLTALQSFVWTVTGTPPTIAPEPIEVPVVSGDATYVDHAELALSRLCHFMRGDED